MACIDNIVTLGICPDEAASESGLTLVQAAGISINNLSNTANENYTNGVNLALEKKTVAITRFKNDFIGALQANKIVATISDPVYDSSRFNTNNSTSTYTGYRGLTVHKNTQYKGSLRKTLIKTIQCYPLASGDAVINLNDGVNTYSYAVTLVGGQINTFDDDSLDGFPFQLPDTASGVRITIDQTEIAFASTDITCMKGCNGSVPNPCAWVDGWDGSRAVKDDGYGLNVQFYCHCDYDQVICDLSKAYTGELIWLKWQLEIFNEQQMSNRFNNFVIYGGEELDKYIVNINNQYAAKWNALMQGVYGILKTYRDDCLDCRGVRWNTNI